MHRLLLVAPLVVVLVRCGPCGDSALPDPFDAGPVDDGGDGVGALDGGGTGTGDLDGGGGSDEDGGQAPVDGGGPTDAGGPIDAGGPTVDGGAPCASSDACTGGDQCVLVAEGGQLVGRCGPPGAGNAIGQQCDAHADCASGLCVVGLCSAPCDDETDCAAHQDCGAQSVTLGGVTSVEQVCIPDIDLPLTLCTTTPDVCDAEERVCSRLVTVPDGGGAFAFACDAPPIGNEPLYADCTSLGAGTHGSDDCASGLCDDETTGACTLVCDDDADCGAGICTSSGLSNPDDARFCGEPCATQAQCGDGRSCVRRNDDVDRAVELVCDGDRGTRQAGEYVDAGATECETALVVCEGSATCAAGTPRYCTHLCAPDAGDCTTEAPSCEPQTLSYPDGGSVNVFICKRP